MSGIPVTGDFKMFRSNIWVTKANMNVGRERLQGGGSVTSTTAAGGTGVQNAPNATEYYDGVSWNTEATIPQGVTEGGSGGKESDLIVLNITSSTSCTQYWDGSTWSTLTAPPVSMFGYNMTGESCSDIIVTSGLTQAVQQSTATCTFDGSSWTTGGGAINRGGINISMGGTQNDTIAATGIEVTGNPNTDTEAYDGTSWSICQNAIYGVMLGGASGGSTNLALMMGILENNTTRTDKVQEFNGTTWFMGENSPVVDYEMRGTGNGGYGALIFGGENTSPQTLSYEIDPDDNIFGAVCCIGVDGPSINNASTFTDLISSTNSIYFDYNYSGNITAPSTQVTSSLQYRGYPVAPYVFNTKSELQTAVDLWVANENSALATYNNINTWDVSNITYMRDLFRGKHPLIRILVIGM